MNIELISIGDELLKGMTVNTNTAFLCRALTEKGYDVARQTTLGDAPCPLAQGLKEALARADLVISTGGLGPTLDDQTRRIAAELFHSGFCYSNAVAEEIIRRYGDQISSLKDQATVPEKAQVLLNKVGTAPGLIFEEGGKTLVLLPGVPIEMQELFSEQVLPYLSKKFPVKEKRSTELHFSILPENTFDPHLRELSQRYSSVEVGIYPSWGTLMVSLRSENFIELTAFEEALKKLFEVYLYPAPNGKIVEALQEWFVRHGQTLAFAESCTGGMMAAQVTSLSGSSEYFLGSFVTYSNALKERILGVPKEVLHSKGAVSEETVRAMLAGVFSQTTADYAIAVSGIAGPTGGTPEKPVGTVWAAIGKRGDLPDVGLFCPCAKGNRQAMILTTTNQLLGALYRKVAFGNSAFPL